MTRTAPIKDADGPKFTRAQLSRRYIVDVARYCGRRLVQDRAPQMAAALAYRTIFSLVPLLVLSLIVLKAFLGEEGIRNSLDQVLQYTGLNEIAVSTAEETTAETAVEDAELSQWIKQFVDNAVERVTNINYSAIAIVGVALFIYAALSLLMQVESSFNHVCRASSNRRLLVRLTNYWTIVTLGTLALFASIGVAQGYKHLLTGWPEWAEWATRPAHVLLRVGITWILLIFAYTRVPNVRVYLRPAAVGALVAAILWEICKTGLAWFIRDMTTSSIAVYGSIALVPLAIFWIYITWLIVIFGLEVAHTIQSVAAERLRETVRPVVQGLVDPSRAVLMLKGLARAFRNGRTENVTELARIAGLTPAVTESLLGAFVQEGLVHRVEGENDDDLTFALARPASEIRIADVVRISYELAGNATDPELDSMLRRVRERAIAGLDDERLGSFSTA